MRVLRVHDGRERETEKVPRVQVQLLVVASANEAGGSSEGKRPGAQRGRWSWGGEQAQFGVLSSTLAAAPSVHIAYVHFVVD